MNLTHGQKVWCEINKEEVVAIFSINKDGKEAFLCHDLWESTTGACEQMFGKTGFILMSSTGPKISNDKVRERKIRLMKDINDITTYEVGDVLVCDGPENEALVVEVFTNTVAVVWNRNRLVWSKLWTIPTIISEGYTRFKDQQEPQKTTVTRQEIADWKGVDVDSIVIE